MSFKTQEGEALFNEAYENNLKRWTVPYETFFLPTSFGQTHIIAAGEKHLPPLIMLHGAGMGSTIWYKNMEVVSKTRRVYAVDVIGDMNKSDPIKSINQPEDIATWFCEILDGLKIEKTDIIGHSAGGYATLNITIYAQHRINKMILLAPAASFVPFHKQFFLRLGLINLIRNKAFIRQFFVNWFIAKGNKIKDYSFDQFIYGVFYYQWKFKPVIPAVIPVEKLKTIKVPTLLLMGEQEVIYNPQKALSQAKVSIPHIKSEWIPCAGHCLFIERADQVNHHIANFLAE